MMNSVKSISLFDPLSCPAQRDDITPSPVGEGWVGGKKHQNSGFSYILKWSQKNNKQAIICQKLEYLSVIAGRT
jgi:hypothetical protein